MQNLCQPTMAKISTKHGAFIFGNIILETSWFIGACARIIGGIRPNIPFGDSDKRSNGCGTHPHHDAVAIGDPMITASVKRIPANP
jgi:hypothetical protein